MQTPKKTGTVKVLQLKESLGMRSLNILATFEVPHFNQHSEPHQVLR